MASAGHSARTSDQVSAVEKMAASSSMVTSVTKSFSTETATAMASVPTRNSMGSRSMAAQDSRSLSLMAREALETSLSPASQKRSKPAPEPMESMVILPPPSPSYIPAMTSASGKTVELPAETTSPGTSAGLTAGSSMPSDVDGASASGFSASVSSVSDVSAASGASVASGTSVGCSI